MENGMDNIYVVLSNGNVHSAHKSIEKASSQVADLCRFEFDNVQYDERGFAQSESGAVSIKEVLLQN